MKLLVAYSAFPDLDSAQKMCRHLLGLKLISCANIVEAGHSLYWWEGEIQEGREVYVWFKTKESLYLDLEKELVANHPYDIPCLWAMSPDQVHPPYLRWAQSSISG